MTPGTDYSAREGAELPLADRQAKKLPFRVPRQRSQILSNPFLETLITDKLCFRGINGHS
jgi:hypothetical protein